MQRVPLRLRQQLQVPVGRQPGTTQPSNSAGPESKDQEKWASWFSLPRDVVEAAVARMLGRVLQDPALDNLVEVGRRAGAADLLQGKNNTCLMRRFRTPTDQSSLLSGLIVMPVGIPL